MMGTTVAEAVECSGLFRAASDRPRETDRKSEAITYLENVPGATTIMVTWISPSPLWFQDFRHLDTEATRLGVTIVTELERQGAGLDQSPVGPGFLNTFVLRGNSLSIASLLNTVGFRDARVAAFEGFNRRKLKQSTEIAALHISSSRERRSRFENFLAERQEQILVINDIDSRAFFAMIDARLYSDYSDRTPLRRFSYSIKMVFENWDVVLSSVHDGQHVYVRFSSGRDFVITDLNEMLSVQARILERNRRWEQADVLFPALSPVVVEKKPETKPEKKPETKPETSAGPMVSVAKQEQLAPSGIPAGENRPTPGFGKRAESPSDLALDDFIAQNELAVGGFFKNPQKGGTEFKVLHLDNQRRFYVLNPYWLGLTGVREIVSTLKLRNPTLPPLSKSARSSLAALINGKGAEGLAYTQRSFWSLTGSSTADGLGLDHARDLTVAFTERQQATKLDEERVRLRYVLVPIPVDVVAPAAAPAVVHKSVAPNAVAQAAPSEIPRAVSEAAPLPEIVVPPRRVKTGPVVNYSTFRNSRAATFGPGGLYPLKSVKVVALQTSNQISFFVLDPSFVAKTPLPEIVAFIESNYADQPKLSERHQQFIAAFKAGSMKSVRHIVHTPSDLGQGGMRARMDAAYKTDRPIVVAVKQAPDDIMMILIPVREEVRVAKERIEEGSYADGIGVAQFMLHRESAIGASGKQPLNSAHPVRILQKQRFGAYFYIVSAEYLRTAKPGAVFKRIQKDFPTLPPLSPEHIKFADAMAAGALPSVPHFTHSLGELSGQGTSTILETAWNKQRPIVAKKASADEAEAQFVLIPIGKPAK